MPGASVANIGEMLEYATGGYLIATNHRVVSPRYPDDRISVPYFFCAFASTAELEAQPTKHRAAPERATSERTETCCLRTTREGRL